MKQDRFTNALTILIVVAISLSTTIASARTWRVEKDGSGDFAVIQEAVDVAASGDTVRIGVGRFDDKRYYTFPGWSDSVRVVVHQYELTIIGSGLGTIIGQEEPWELDQGHHKAIVTGQVPGILDNSILRVQKIQFENVEQAVDTSYEFTEGSHIEIQNCRFVACRQPLVLFSTMGGQALVTDCSFDELARDDVAIHCWGQDSVIVSNCVFDLEINPTWGQQHFGSWGVTSVVLKDCIFTGGTSAAAFYLTDSVLVKDCEFSDQKLFALTPLDGSMVVVEGCVFRNQERAIEALSFSGGLLFERCEIGGVADCSFLVSRTSGITARDSDIDRGIRGTLWLDDDPNCGTPSTLDFTNNYWYTDNPDSIAAWIHDRNDSDEACYFVDFEPFRSESTPVEQRSLADIKNLFR